MTLFDLEIISPQGWVYQGKTMQVMAPGKEGDVGILADHMPFLSVLKSGIIRFSLPDQPTDQKITIQGGYLYMEGNLCTILATPS